MAIKQFLNHYNIPFTPLHMFNQSITNPLFLTLYCKTYQGDDIELPLLYDRLLSVANDNIHKAMRTALENLGYDSSIDLTTPVVMELAKFVILTGKRQFSKREICDVEVWKQYGIQAQAFIQYMVRENILHNYMYKDSEEMFYFSYDQMNDYFCAKQILNQHHLKTELSEYMAKKVLGIQNGELTTYENIDLFVYLCALYADKYHEECISIIDDINDEQDRDEVFNSYVESFKWRNTQNINLSTFWHLCEKYSVRFEMIWDMFITNSLKSQSCFNSNGLHTVLSRYPLNQRDYLWTRYINDIGCSSEHRLVQVIRMYSEGKGLTFTNRCQVELLLVLFSWILTSSNRWLRDTTSKAMVEVLKQNFDMAENLLRKFEEIDDPYIIQRMYGVVWGACVKKGYIDKQIFNSLTKYVYEKIFSAKIVYPDILLRDYAKLIVERYMYENPDDNSFDVSLIMPPYSSEPIPQIVDQGYLENNYEKGLRYLISSMRFQNSGWYGDFGRYVYESALNHFDVDHSLIFNFSVFYIINHLGYSNELFGEYDGYLQEFNYNRHNTNRVERIGKKYQWIAMYHVLARVADNCKKKDSFSLTSESYKYQGPWDPDVRDFDPSLSEYFMSNKNLPLFYNSIGSKIDPQKGDQRVPNSTQEELAWIKQYPTFFEIQKQEMIIKDLSETEWIVLSKYADTGRSSKDKLKIWNCTYGYFVTKEQYDILRKYSDKKVDLLNDEISTIPGTYTIFCREYPWSRSCEGLNTSTHMPMKIKTGKKMTVMKTYHVIDYLSIEDPLVKDFEISEANRQNDMKNSVYTLKMDMKEVTGPTEIDMEEDIGVVISASVNLMWEKELDLSKKETLSWYAPCAELINSLKLRYGVTAGV